MIDNQNFSIELIKDSKFKKEFLVTANAVEISKLVDADIAVKAKTFKLAGFSRAGGAPVSLVKRQIGKQVMSEHIDKLIQGAILKIVKDHNFNMSGMPAVDITEFNPEGDIKISVIINVMADVPELNLSDDQFRIELLELNISRDDINQAKNALTKMVTSYGAAPEGHIAALGDAVIIDFHGKLNGEEFDGNKAEQIRIDIGDGNFIKDFEEKLIGLKKGDEKVLKVQFPSDYNEEKLAGQEVDFEVKVHDILVRDTSVDIDMELLKRFEVESLERLDEMIKEKIIQDFNSIVRVRSKKHLFDKIDSAIAFELPEEMIEGDFNNMWKDISPKIAAGQINKTEEDARAELQNIARRRVKLGLLLADIAKKNQIMISEEDLENAKNLEKSKRPDQTAAIDEFFSKQENKEILQGAILEEKVVDFILGKVQTYSISVTTTEFNDKYAKEIQDLIQ
jgi:trigger factor